MTLEQVQWGNAQGDGGLDTTTCQHGDVECFVMRKYACDKYLNGNGDEHLAMVDCFDEVMMTAFPAVSVSPSSSACSLLRGKHTFPG